MITDFNLFESKDIFHYNDCYNIFKRRSMGEIKNNGDDGEDCDVNLQDKRGTTFLSSAVYLLDLKLVKCLLENGADTNLESRTKNTALTNLGQYIYNYNIIVNSDGGSDVLKILKLLLKYGADLTIKNNDDKDFFDYLYQDDNLNYIITHFSEDYKKYIINKNINKYKI